MGPASRFEDLSSRGPPGDVEAVCNAIPKILILQILQKNVVRVFYLTGRGWVKAVLESTFSPWGDAITFARKIVAP